jgi:hypothetical protein
MSAEEYGWYVFYQGSEAVTILGEGVRKYPDSEMLLTYYMQALAKVGRKEEAWKAYQRSRDLYFAHVERSLGPPLPVDSQAIELPPLPPVLLALPWYTFLLQEGKDDESSQLEDRLREACRRTKSDPKGLLLPRATAEFGSGRYAAAAKSLERCLREKLWNELASEANITGALAKSLRALGRRQDAVRWYRRAVEISRLEPGLLAEFLCLVVEEEGVNGLLREMGALDQSQIGLDVRRNATLSCFNSWIFLAVGNDKTGFEFLVQAVPLVGLADQQPILGSEEGLVCGVILQIVAEKLADTKRLAFATEFLKRFPPERVKAMREVFVLPKPT